MPYSVGAIPEWCQMPMDEHRCAGGCWGILHGDVARKGQEHCKDCDYNSLAKGIAMPLTFKQQVALVLLQNLEWMPKFDDVKGAAEYLSIETPTTTGGAIGLSQQAIAVMVAETAERIVEAVG